MRHLPIVLLISCVFAFSASVSSQQPEAKSGPTLVDPSGKELQLKKWKIVAGTKKISWMDGSPECFEMREIGSTTFKEGINTYIPLSRLKAIRYAYDKELAYVDVAGLEKPLEGTVRFKDINAFTVEAEVEQGGMLADLHFKGGLLKGGFQSITFPGIKDQKPVEPAADPVIFLAMPEGKGKTAASHPVHNIQALYKLSDGSEKLLNWVMFKKTLKIELPKVMQFSVSEYNLKEKTAECEVQLSEKETINVTLLTQVTEGGKQMTLVGIVGEVPAGRKLFPIHTFQNFRTSAVKEPTPKAKLKELLPEPREKN